MRSRTNQGRAGAALRLLAAVVVGLAASLAVPASARVAGAVPTVNFGPTSGLSAGNRVVADGSGFVAGTTVTLAQCSPAGCAFPDFGQTPVVPSNWATATVRPDGAFTLSITVHLAVDEHSCRPDHCRVEVAAAGSGVVAAEPISFVTPTRTLEIVEEGPVLDAQPITVRGLGYDHKGAYRVAQCWGEDAGSCRSAADEPADAGFWPTGYTGAVANDVNGVNVPLFVRRQITIGGVERDCSGTGCRVSIIDRTGEVLSSTPLSMAPTGNYQWPTAVATVTPVAMLLDGDTVNVSATGLSPWSGTNFPGARLLLCVDSPDAVPGRCQALGADQWDNDPMFVRRQIWRGDTIVAIPRHIATPDGAYDCAAIGCAVVVDQTHHDPTHPRSNPVPVTFAPEWHPWPTVDAFLTEGVEAVRGAPLGAAERGALRVALEQRHLTGAEALALATDGAPADATVGETARLYRAFFDRSPDAGGLAYWSDRLRRGESPAVAGRAFGGTPEFRSMYGSVSNATVVERAYRNTLGRVPDAAGRAYWIDRLDRGLARSALIVHFARSPEFRARSSKQVAATLLLWGTVGQVPLRFQVEMATVDFAEAILRSGDVPG